MPPLLGNFTEIFDMAYCTSDSFQFNFSFNYFGKTYFPVFVCSNLCFHIFVLVLSLFAFSVLALTLQHFSVSIAYRFED